MTSIGQVSTVTDENFCEVLQGGTPVLVDFWATWCGACQLMFSTLSAVAREFDGRLLVMKLDVDKSPLTAERYDIGPLPTLKLFYAGQVLHTVVGARTTSSLVTELSPFLEGHPSGRPG